MQEYIYYVYETGMQIERNIDWWTNNQWRNYIVQLRVFAMLLVLDRRFYSRSDYFFDHNQPEGRGGG